MGGPHLELFSRLHKFPQYNYVEKSQWSVYTFNIGKVKKLQYPLDNNFLSIFVLSPCQHQVFLSLEKREEERREGEGRGRFLFREACWRRHDSPSFPPSFRSSVCNFQSSESPGGEGKNPLFPPSLLTSSPIEEPRNRDFLRKRRERRRREEGFFAVAIMGKWAWCWVLSLGKWMGCAVSPKALTYFPSGAPPFGPCMAPYPIRQTAMVALRILLCTWLKIVKINTFFKG